MPRPPRIRTLFSFLLVVATLLAMGDRATGATSSSTVGADVLVAVTFGTGGCNSGVAGTTSFGTISAGTTIVGTGDCHLTWSTNAPTARLRMFQTDGAGVAMTSAGSSIPDYDQGTNDWTVGSGAFGACLRTVGATTTSDWAPDATCAATDAAYWNGIPATAGDPGARVAGSDSTGEVRLRFGMRAANNQLAQAYSAGVTFEVIAPDPGPGAPPVAGAVTVAGTAAIGQTLTANPTGWNMGTPAGSYTYQWIRCGTGGGTCIDIAGQTSSTYVVTGTDGGRTLRVRVAVSNVHGTATLTSTQTAIIIDAVGNEGGTTASTVANATQLTVVRPPNAFEGDVLVAQVVVRDGTDVVFTSVPAGWTLIRRQDELNRVATATYRKTLTAAEPAGYTWQWNVSDRATIGVQAFSAVDHTTPVSAHVGASGESMTAAAGPIAIADANSFLLAIYGTRDTVTFADNNGMNPMWDIAGGGGNVGAFGRWQPFGVDPSESRSAGLSITTEWAAQLIVLRPRP